MIQELLVPLLSALLGAGGGVGAAAGIFRARELRKASDARAAAATRIESERTEQATLKSIAAVRSEEVIAERVAIEAANATTQAMIRGLFEQNLQLHERIIAVENAANAAKRELESQRDNCHNELVAAMAIAQDAAARVEMLQQELSAERQLREKQEQRYTDLIAEIRRHHGTN